MMASFLLLLDHATSLPTDEPPAGTNDFQGRPGDGDTVMKGTDRQGVSAYTDPGSGQPSGSGLPGDGNIARKFTRFVSVGDSFSAGPGAGNNIGFLGENCYRTDGGWPSQLSKQPGLLKDPSKFSFLSCTGKSTTEILRDQVKSEAFTEGGLPDLVTVTTGGNDNNAFATLVESCPYWLVNRNGRTCDQAVDNARNTVGKTADDTTQQKTDVRALIDGIVIDKQRRAPRLVVVVQGYPHLYNDQTPLGTGLDCWLTVARKQAVNQLISDLNLWVLKKTVDDVMAAKKQNDPDADYVVMYADPNRVDAGQPTQNGFEGHRFCEVWNRAYFQGLPGGQKEGDDAYFRGMFHPNAFGMTIMKVTAQNVLATLPA